MDSSSILANKINITFPKVIILNDMYQMRGKQIFTQCFNRHISDLCEMVKIVLMME